MHCSGFSTFADVIKRRHLDRYFNALRSYMLRCKRAQQSGPSAGAAQMLAVPFSAYDDKKGYSGQGELSLLGVIELLTLSVAGCMRSIRQSPVHGSMEANGAFCSDALLLSLRGSCIACRSLRRDTVARS